jgi:putative endonuclease
LGNAAEERAAEFLRSSGLELLLRNYRCRMGELDLIARQGNTLIVAEVRMRSSAGHGGAGASITWRKRQRIVRTTRHLLARHPALQSLAVRFDALLVDGASGRIEWVRAAFDAF